MDVANVAPNPLLVTDEQATAIGNVIASVRLSDVPAVALKQVVKSHAVLRAMKSGFVWFIPMLEVLVVPKIAQPRRSTWMQLLNPLATATAPVAPTDAASDVDIDDDESGFSGFFSSVVRPEADSSHIVVRSCGRCLGQTARKYAPSQVPVDACASEVVGVPREEIVAAEPETSAASEPHEESRTREIDSVAWPGTFESSPMDNDVSGGHVERSVAQGSHSQTHG
jgi:hypothetical protein